MERIFSKNFARNHEKNNTWNIRRLVDDSFVPSSKRPNLNWRILYPGVPGVHARSARIIIQESCCSSSHCLSPSKKGHLLQPYLQVYMGKVFLDLNENSQMSWPQYVPSGAQVTILYVPYLLFLSTSVVYVLQYAVS